MEFKSSVKTSDCPYIKEQHTLPGLKAECVKSGLEGEKEARKKKEKLK